MKSVMKMDSDDETENRLKGLEDRLNEAVEQMRDSQDALRQEVMDMIPIVRDFKGLLQRKPLFERSTFVYLNPLAKEIKAEIMREVSSRLIGPAEELKIIKTEVDIALDDINGKASSFKGLFEELSSGNKEIKKENQIISQNLDLLQRNVEDVREDILLKAPYNEVTRIVEKLATKATIDDLASLKDQLSLCPTSDQLEKLFSQIEALNQQMASYASQDMVKQMEVGLLTNVDSKFEHYISASTLNEEIDKVIGLIREANSSIEFFKTRQEKSISAHKREVEKIQRLLQGRPWTKDIELVSVFIDEKLNKKEFELFKQDIAPQIALFDEKVKLFGRRVEGFDRVIERYDEILLDKASKDDVTEIKERLPKLLLAVDFEYFKEIDAKQKEMLDEKLLLSHASVHDIEQRIAKFNSSYKSFKAQNKEFMVKYGSVKDLEYRLESKADKSDIYAMFDYTARREEVKLTTQALEVFRKQLEMAVMFQLVTTKTMMKTNESPALKNRQRADVFNNLNTLMEWISQSIPPEVDALMDSARSVLGINQRRSTPQESEPVEPMLPLLGNNKKYKRHAVSYTPALESKGFSDAF